MTLGYKKMWNKPMKLFIQLELAENAIPGPRVLRGKISEMIHQEVGPHEKAKFPI